MPIRKLPQGPPQSAAGCAYNRDMKTIQHLNLSHIMEAYKAKLHAEHAAAEARREAYRNGEAKPMPTTVWDISDRH